MVKYWYIWIWLIISATPALAVENFSFYGLLYSSGISYKNSAIKKDATQMGAYLFLGFPLKHELEVERDSTGINYQDEALDRKLVLNKKLEQTDSTLVYSSYWAQAWKIALGLHTVKSDDKATDKGKVTYLGLDYYRPYLWSLGLDLFQSVYPDYLTTETLTINQLSPRLGLFFCQAKCYSETVGYLITLPSSVSGTKSSKTVTSWRETISFSSQGWTIKGFYWQGTQQFVVRDRVFILFNTVEKHLGGYGGSVSIPIATSGQITFSGAQEKFKDPGSSEESTASVIAASLGASF
jgi:hypothetical protein